MHASTLPNTSHHPSLAFTVLYRTCPLTLTHRASLFHLHALLHTTLSPAFTSSPCAPSLCTCFRPTAYSPPTLNHAHFIPLYDRPSSSSFHFHNPAHPSHSFIHSILNSFHSKPFCTPKFHSTTNPARTILLSHPCRYTPTTLPTTHILLSRALLYNPPRTENLKFIIQYRGWYKCYQIITQSTKYVPLISLFSRWCTNPNKYPSCTNKEDNESNKKKCCFLDTQNNCTPPSN